MPLPISWPSNQNGFRNRPPGNIRADCPPLRHRGRNLLAGQNVEVFFVFSKFFEIYNFRMTKRQSVFGLLMIILTTNNLCNLISELNNNQDKEENLYLLNQTRSALLFQWIYLTKSYNYLLLRVLKEKYLRVQKDRWNWPVLLRFDFRVIGSDFIKYKELAWAIVRASIGS